MTSRYRRQPVHTPRFSRLEQAVMQALAWELRHTVSDLDAQFELASAGRRVNTGSGFHHEIIGDRSRAAPPETPTGLFGSVHALIDGLEDAVLFQVQLRNGQILALVADAYDQDTRHIDFQTAGFEQVFYIDADGASRPFDAKVLLSGNRPAWERSEWEPPEPLPPIYRYAPPAETRPSRPPPKTAEQRAADTLGSALKGVAHAAGVPTATPEPAGAPMDPTTLRIGVWIGLFALAIILAILTEISFVFAGIGAFWLARLLTRPAALDAIGRILADRRWRPEG